MQYYIKIFNKSTNELVGYYKETGLNSITKLPKGMKYFNSWKDAMIRIFEIDDGFIRDKDRKYYNCHAVIYGDHTREPSKSIYRPNYNERGDEFNDAIEAIIRQNSSRSRR